MQIRIYLPFFLLTLMILGISCQQDNKTNSGEVAYSTSTTSDIVVSQKDLIPEGIAHDAKTGHFYLSSIHKRKIVKVDSKGNASDFIQTEQDGYLGGVGLEVDEKRNCLWALMWSQVGEVHKTGLFQYDLASGQLLHKHLLENTTGTLLNDLEVHPDGSLYLSNSLDGGIYHLPNPEGELSLWWQDTGYKYLNGITLSDDGKTLYVASFKTAFKVDIASKTASNIHPEGTVVSSKGLDGLYYYKNGLLGVFNGNADFSKHGIFRYELNKKGMVKDSSVIDQNQAYFSVPTTGVIVGNQFYVVANSQMTQLDQTTNSIKAPERLQDVFIKAYNLP
ncbi:MAG: SMP-30/gluconolactonase/LRE family protein [Chitinophagales bacterium]